MPPRDSPVETQLAGLVPEGVQSRSRGSYARPVGSRNLLLIPNVGNVLGIDRNGHGNPQISERKVQSGIDRNGPGRFQMTEEDVQCGLILPKKTDNVAKRGVREVRNKVQSSPLNRVPPSKRVPRDTEREMMKAYRFEVVGGLRCGSKMQSIVEEIVQGVEHEMEPVAVTGGMGGAYYFRNTRGENIAIVKPNDEEPFAPNNPKGYVGKNIGELGPNRAVRVGDTGIREVAAYLLDHKHFARVPPTSLVRVSHHAFHMNGGVSGSGGKPPVLVEKLASCQQYVKHEFDASDHGSSRFSVSAVHRIGILDIRIFNMDRHAGNILVQRGKPVDNLSSVVNEALDLIPIDHGLCLPESLGDPYFEWLHWPQSSLPFSEEELVYIKHLDENKDAEMLRQVLPTLREACLRVLILSTIVLKRGAEDGLCLAHIGEMMSRDGIGGPSQLELLCIQAKQAMESIEEDFDNDDDDDDDDDDDAISAHSEVDEQFEVEMDEDEESTLLKRTIPGGRYGAKSHVNYSNQASALGEECGKLNVPDCGPASKAIRNTRASETVNRLSRFAIESPRLDARGDQSPRLGSECHPINRSGFRPLVEEDESQFLAEEEEVNVPERKHKDWLTECKASASTPRARSYKSSAFIRRNKPYHHEHKVPPSEVIGKANVPPAFSLGDMSDKEWKRFLDHFKELLEEALVVKSNQTDAHRQRLGISCQF